jgi:hypothetical protein
MRLLSFITQRLLAASCAAPLLAACAHGVATHAADIARPTDVAESPPLRTADGPGTYAFVEAIWDYRTPRDVPAAFRHVVDWHGGTDRVVLLLSAGGQLACAITPVEAVEVSVGRPYRCRWRSAR